MLNATLVVNGLLVLGLALAVRRTVAAAPEDRWAAVLVATFGVALVLGGLFPCDADCRPTTVQGWVHLLNVVPAGVATIGSPFLLHRAFARDARLTLFSSASLILGVLVAAAVLAAFGLFPHLQLEGLGQRIVLALQLASVVLTATAVVHVSLHALPDHSPRRDDLRRPRGVAHHHP